MNKQRARAHTPTVIPLSPTPARLGLQGVVAASACAEGHALLVILQRLDQMLLSLNGHCPAEPGQIPLQLHRTARLITFPAAGWTVRTADNKNSLGDGGVIAFVEFFYFYILLIFPGLLFLMNSDRMTLALALKQCRRGILPGHLCSLIFSSRNKEINLLSKKIHFSLNWDITRKWNLNSLSKNI